MGAEFTFSLVQTKQLTKNAVNVCVWSPKTDLIALGSQNGNVSVHRYKMTCIWESSLPDLGEVTCLTWRSDGKILTAGYLSGAIRFFTISDGFIFYQLQLKNQIDYLSWTSFPVYSSDENRKTLSNSSNLSKRPSKTASSYFPPLNLLTLFKSDVNFSVSDVCKLERLISDLDDDLHILTVYSKGMVYFYGYGIFELAKFSLHHNETSNEFDENFEFFGCHLTGKLNNLILVESYRDKSGNSYVELLKIPSNGFQQYAKQLHKLSTHAYSIRITKALLDWSFKQISVSWEDMILEMGTKLTKYGRESLKVNKNWSLSVEFLELILLGSCSVPLHTFLVKDWTAASLKRAGTATLKAYESIEMLCFQQIQFFLQRLLFHSSELLGSLRDKQMFNRFSIPPSSAITLFRTLAVTLQKAQELQSVIDKSIEHLRAFYKWIYAEILSLSGNVFPDDFPRVTPAERESVIHFLTNYLQPIFIDDELQNYQIDLVEQYIRPGKVRKPLEAVVQSSLKNDQERAQLRHILNELIKETDVNHVPDGVFNYCPEVTLADLIQKRIDEDIQNLFNISAPYNFTRDCLDLNSRSSNVLCKFRFQCGYKIVIDNILVDQNPMNLTYQLKDLHFYTSQTLLLLVSRPKLNSNSDAKCVATNRDADSMISWLVMLPIQKLFNSTPSPSSSSSSEETQQTATYDGDNNNAFVSFMSDSIQTSFPTRNLSELIQSTHVEALHWPAKKLTCNGDRSIVFVLFENCTTCRIYLIEKPETDENSQIDVASTEDVEHA